MPDASRSVTASAGQTPVVSTTTAATSSLGDVLPIDLPDISFDTLQAFLENPDKDSQRASLLASFNSSQLGETMDLLKQCQEEFKATGIGSLKASSYNDSATFRNFSASFNRLLTSPGTPGTTLVEGQRAQPAAGYANANDDDDDHAFDWDSIT